MGISMGVVIMWRKSRGGPSSLGGFVVVVMHRMHPFCELRIEKASNQKLWLEVRPTLKVCWWRCLQPSCILCIYILFVSKKNKHWTAQPRLFGSHSCSFRSGDSYWKSFHFSITREFVSWHISIFSKFKVRALSFANHWKDVIVNNPIIDYGIIAGGFFAAELVSLSKKFDAHVWFIVPYSRDFDAWMSRRNHAL